VPRRCSVMRAAIASDSIWIADCGDDVAGIGKN
jgi:hypothetical protein